MLWERLQTEALTVPAGPLVKELRAGEAENQQGDVSRPLDDVLDEIKQRWLGPVNVLKHEHQWAFFRKRLEEFPVGPERFLGACRLLGVGCFGWPRGKTTKNLLQRPEGDPLAIGEAATLKYRRLLLNLGRELDRDARLTD